METMSLVGGIDTYRMGKRFKEDLSPKGRKVYFLNKNGYDIEREAARKYFKENDVLIVNEIYVGRSSSEVEFLEVPKIRFNTIMFADYK